MENLILSKLENLKRNNNNKNFYNKDKELYRFLLSKDFFSTFSELHLIMAYLQTRIGYFIFF